MTTITKIIHIFFLHILIYYPCKSASSGEANYSLMSIIKFPSELTIEKNSLFSDRFNLLTDSPSNYNKATGSSKIIFDSTSYAPLTFTNMNHLYWEVTQETSNLSLSVSGGNCEFPLIFGSKIKPTFSMTGDIGKLEVSTSLSDFSSHYGSSKTVSGANYSTTLAGSTYTYINVICPFYNNVNF
jgi:hypothetical protein